MVNVSAFFFFSFFNPFAFFLISTKLFSPIYNLFFIPFLIYEYLKYFPCIFHLYPLLPFQFSSHFLIFFDYFVHTWNWFSVIIIFSLLWFFFSPFFITSLFPFSIIFTSIYHLLRTFLSVYLCFFLYLLWNYPLPYTQTFALFLFCYLFIMSLQSFFKRPFS